MEESERRRLKIESVWDAWLADPTYHDQRNQLIAPRAERATEALKLLNELQSTSDPDAFRNAMQAWCQRPGYSSFNGFGMMFLHQIVNYTGDAVVASELLVDILSKPETDDEAAAKIRRCVAHVEKIKRGGQPAPKRAPFVLSLFWSMADHEMWPCLWQSADAILSALGWLPSSGDLDERYLEYRDIALSSGHTPYEIEVLLWWIDEAHPFTGLDPALVDRCAENLTLADAWRTNGDEYLTVADAAKAERNARSMLGELKLIGAGLDDRVSTALGRPVSKRFAGLKYNNIYRADSYVVWATGDTSDEPSLWLWVTESGVAVGLQPGWREEGWTRKVRDELVGTIPEGLEFIRFHNRIGDRFEVTGDNDPKGQFLVGRFYPAASALGDRAFADQIVEVADSVKSVLDRITQLRGGSGSVSTLVARFIAERPYPTADDVAQIQNRAHLAESLTTEALEEFDLDAFRQIISTGRYGGPGPMSILNRSLTEADAEGLARLAASITYLLWESESPVAERIDRLLDQSDLGMKGLGESVIMKLLAIAHPDEFLPAFPYRGEKGKKRFMELLELPVLAPSDSPGHLQIESNRLLREQLDPVLPDDLWGQAQFLYWLAEQPAVVGPEIEVAVSPVDLASLNEELLLEAGFLDEVVSLLEEKRQIIFYGPPGTGKTYIAKKLAQALTPDSSRRAIMQFHPSMSYEDFFEGYRPLTNEDGAMTYSLVPGPLARMADRASQAPSVIKHVLVVDEINRANLPKVLGELLFLLEYRNESIQTLYRPDRPFRLPDNLYFIGTMNTADRSIALVDAALRRRFHFIPFFPEQDQMQGVLRRWLERNDGDVRIASLVEQVNQELVLDVGEHLQIGPSYFMRPSIAESDLRRIWKYSIEPFIEEQLFGQTDEIKRYRWNEVRQRFWGTLTESPDSPEILEEDTPEVEAELN